MSVRDVSPCVLIIEDDPDHRELIREQLGAGVSVIGASDGLEGYRLACVKRPAAIVLDLAMPMVDGWTVLRKLRSNPLTSSVPVIVVSGLDRPTILDDAKRLGVESVVQKPYEGDQLREAISAAIRSRPD